jgi:WD40 repeat protein
LVPFTVADADYFFGRERETELVTANLVSRRLTLMFGPSGVGKSSVLRAGVLHRLRTRARERVERIGYASKTVQEVISGRVALPALSGAVAAADDALHAAHAALGESSEPTKVVMLREDEERLGPALPPIPVLLYDWRDDPVRALAERIRKGVEQVYGPCSPPEGIENAQLPELLRAWTSQLRADLHLLLDQFDDFFLYHSAEGSGGFGDQLAAVMADPSTRTNLLLSFREDNLAQLDRFRDTIPNLFSNYLRLDYMTRSAARCAIMGPVQRHNQRAPEHERAAIESRPSKIESRPANTECLPGAKESETLANPPEGTPGLVDEVLDQVRTSHALGEAGHLAEAWIGPQAKPEGNRVETPYLQLVMARLWEEETNRWTAAGKAGRRTLRASTLRELGGAERIVSEHLTAVLGSDPARQSTAAHVFERLVTSEGRKIALTIPELVGAGQADGARVRALVEYLEKRSVLRNAGPPPGDRETDETRRWEIAHDVLAKAALRWRREYLQLQAVLEAEDRTLKRARKRSLLAFAIILVISVVIALILGERAKGAREREAMVLKAQKQGISNTLTALARFHLPLDPGLAAALAFTADTARPDTAVGDAEPPLRVLQRALFEPVIAAGDSVSTGANPINSLHHLGGRRFFATTLTGQLLLVDSTVTQLDTVAGPVDAAILLPGDSVAVVASGRPGSHLRRIGVSRQSNGREPLGGHTERIYALSLGPDRRTILSAANDGRVLLHPDSGPSRRIGAQNEGAVSVASTRSGLIAAGGEGGMLRLWSPTGTRMAYRLRHKSWISSLAFDTVGTRLLSASQDNTAGLWRVALEKGAVPVLEHVRMYQGHTGSVVSAEFSPDGSRVLTASRDGTARIWETETGRLLAVMRHPTPVRVARFLPDDTVAGQGDTSRRAIHRKVATGADDGTIRVWTWSDRVPVAVADSSTKATSSPDGRRIATVGSDSSIIVRDARTRQVIQVRKLHEDAPVGVTFTPGDPDAASPSDYLLVAATANGFTVAWNFVGDKVGEWHPRDDPSVIVTDRAGSPWIIVPRLGAAQVYRCDVCMPRETLMERFPGHIRALNGRERKQYLGQDVTEPAR